MTSALFWFVPMATPTVFAQNLSLEELEKVVPKQAFRIGKSIVGCGDVSGIKISQSGETKTCSGFIHSEKTAKRWYQVTCTIFSNGSVVNPSCVCHASPNMRTHSCCCKHVSALLLSLYALENCKNLNKHPKIFRRPNMNRFAEASPYLQEKVEFHLTWEDVLSRMTMDPPKKRSYSSSYDVFQTGSTPQKRARRSTPRADYLGWTCEKLREKLREKGENFFGRREELVERWKKVIEGENETATQIQ